MQAAPEPGALAAAPPRQVALSFSEPVVRQGSSIVLLGPGGRSVPLGRAVRHGDRALAARVRGRLDPAVYAVRWTALGDDGHIVSGRFRFGVPRPGGGPPEGAESLGAPGTAGHQSAGGDTPAGVIARWLGLAAAGVLFAGALLRARLDEDGEARRRQLAAGALVAVAIATWYAVVAAADAGRGTSVRVLVAQPTGMLALVRLGVLLVLGAAALAVRGGRAGYPRAESLLLATAGGAALVTYALAGHVQTVSGAPALAVPAQVLHVLAAGAWMGGLVTIAVAGPPSVRSLRAFAPIAAGSVAVLALTGLLAAFREVHAWYFLRWSGYGRVVIAKSVLLLLLGPAAAAAALALRRGRAAAGALRLEALGALTLVLLAATLAGLVPGRGQALPAQRGNLLVGAAFGTVPVRGGGQVRLTLAPAREGPNTISATPPSAARSVAVTLTCGCAGKAVGATLRRGRSGTWSARVHLPARGSWVAAVSVDGAPGEVPASLAAGDARVAGSSPREATMTADLTGPDALRCRAAAQGAILAVGRLDARGGLPGGRKASLRVEDDGGDPARAAALVRAARGRGAIALLAPCGAGAAGALLAAGGLPAVAADPGAAPVPGARTWRTAGDPRAEGVAIARYMLERGAGLLARRAPRRVAVLSVRPGAASAARRAGLESVLRPNGVRLVGLTTRASTAAIDPRRYFAALLDGEGDRVAAVLREVGARAATARSESNLLVAASPLLDERFEESAGALGASGAIASASEVVPGSVDGIRYASQARALYPGDRPSISGLRGYVAGLALGEGLRDGDDAGRIAARLRRPRRFTDALVAPWRDDAPAAGATLFTFLAPRLVSPTLAPALGGHPPAGTFFERGTWAATTSRVYGPKL